MRTGLISTANLWNTPRNSIARLQGELAQRTQELGSGRLYDVGLKLGTDTARATGLHLDVSALEANLASNSLTAARLQRSDEVLRQFAEDADAFLKQILTASGHPNIDLKATAAAALDKFIGTANLSEGRDYLLAGIQTATAPLSAYGSGPKGAVDAAFLAAFGVTQDDAGVAGIDAAAMDGFLASDFADLFGDPAWATHWSSASDQPTRAKISFTEKIDTSISANNPVIRALAMAYTMVSELGVDGLSEDARQRLIDGAANTIRTGLDGITSLRTEIGTRQNRVTEASERLQIQRAFVQQQIGVTEGVDPAELKIRIDTLSTQIEMSYALTAQVSRMTLLSYL